MGSLEIFRINENGAGWVSLENVGMSNDNEGEKPSRRKTKDSSAMLINWGLVGG